MIKHIFVLLIAMITPICYADNTFLTCYTADKFAYRILKDKYRQIPIEQSSYYHLDNQEIFSENFATILKLMTEEIYALPFETEKTAREKQVQMVTNFVSMGCFIAMTKEN